MLQIVEQTHEEKVKMYMKLPKKKIVEMLIACNTIFASYDPIYENDKEAQNIKLKLHKLMNL